MTSAERRKIAVATLSVASNTVLVILKVIVGLMIGSVSVLSEAIHSGVDLIAAAIALFAVKTSGQPADRDHNFGHGKIENVSGVIEALLIFLAAGWIIFEAAEKLLHPKPMDDAAWGVAVMLVSAAANTVVSHMLFKVGRETDSVALQADAWHLRTDVYTSAGVMFGLGIIWVGKRLYPDVDLHWIDPVAAIAVALLIVKAAYDLTLASARDLLDVSLPEEEQARIQETIRAFAPAVRGVHDFRTRKAGSYRFVEFHLMIDENLSVAESHRLDEAVTEAIREEYADASVTIHVDPCTRRCTVRCLDNCYLSPDERRKAGASDPSSEEQKP